MRGEIRILGPETKPKYVPRKKYPFYSAVPKGFLDNLAYREEKVMQGFRSPEDALDLWIACSRDLLFFINTFVWIFEPRTAKILPFITYDYQDEALDEIVDSVGRHDEVIEKSRDMGATWMILTTLDWFYLFHDLHTFLVLSRKEELVDKRGDPKTLFAKLDFIHKYLPAWLRPPGIERLSMHMRNLGNEATIDGESTNEFSGVADRRTALFLDEFSKMPTQDVIWRGTRDVTRSRIVAFTPQGGSNVSYDIAHNPNIRLLTLHWSRHPDKGRGLYKVDRDGTVQILDRRYWTDRRIKKYDFCHERPENDRFHYRSPWYDEECRRAASPTEIAQELDIDYLGSQTGFFRADEIARVVERDVRPPFLTGELEWSPGFETLTFADSEVGRFQLWTNLDARDQPLQDREYVVGVDLSAGTGASNSVLTIGDTKTGEQVGEFVSPNDAPHVFAEIAVAACKWFKGSGAFHGALLIWEMNGPPGRMFGDAVLKLGYSHIYYRRNEDTLDRAVSDVPGWFASRNTNAALLGAYRAALGNTFIVRSKETLDECRYYVYMANGTIGHSGSARKDDPSGARANHGDRVRAGALCNWAMRDVEVSATPVAAAVPAGCLMARRLEQQREDQQQVEVLAGF